MINKGVPDSIVDFWLGHVIGEMAEAYKRGKFEELKKMYLEREPFISISAQGEIEQKLRKEIDEKNRQLQTVINSLAIENMQLKQKLEEHEQEIEKMENYLTRFQDSIKNLNFRMEKFTERTQSLVKVVRLLVEAGVLPRKTLQEALELVDGK